MQEDEASDNEALPGLNAIDTCVNINRVCAENGEHAHVDMVNDAQVYDPAEDRSEQFWNYNTCNAIVSNKQRECGDSGNNQFMPPFQIDDIINET